MQRGRKLQVEALPGFHPVLNHQTWRGLQQLKLLRETENLVYRENTVRQENQENHQKKHKTTENHQKKHKTTEKHKKSIKIPKIKKLEYFLQMLQDV